MEYRDDRDALRQRAENLEAQLAEANEQLKEARERYAAQAQKDEEEERRVAELEAQADELRRRLGLPPGRVISKPKEESSTAMIVVLGGLVVFALLVAGGVLVFVITSPGAGEAPSPPSPVMPLVIGGVFAVFGLPLVWLALHTFRKDRDIAKWPRAPGKILSSRVASSSYTAKDRDGYSRQYTSYSPEVSFTYVVDGTEYEGSAVARSVDSTSNRASVEACVDRYARGKEIMVFYDPSDPTTSYLEVRRSIGAMILLGFGALLTAIGVLIMRLYFT